MNNNIPKIIHQLWLDENQNIPSFLTGLSKTWTTNHPMWKYELWNSKRVYDLMNEHFPELFDQYNAFRYDEQRYDIARYMVLSQMGGMFVEMDYESIGSIDNLLNGSDCYFSIDPNKESTVNNSAFISNALILSTKNNEFIKYLLSNIPKDQLITFDKEKYISETTGSCFLNNLYQKYTLKDNVFLFPVEQTSPCTMLEIQSYLRGSLTDDEMEEKLSDAVAVRYYLNMKTGQKVNSQKTDVLYLSGVVGDGGAPIAAYRIHSGLRELGIESKMLTLHSTFGQREDIHVAIPDKKRKCGTLYDRLALKDYPNASRMFSTATVGVNVPKYVDMFDPAIVQLHWVNGGFVTIEDLGKIKKKVVWRLPDCWAFTGGCYYFGECESYQNSCGKCPLLDSDKEKDLSHKIWKRKKRAWRKMEMTIVVPTPWMKEMAQKSSLLKGYKIEIIPNGLDIDKFSPLDKEASRKILKLPTDKKIILYGAANAINDPRKGFTYLLQALQKLSEKHRHEYHLVIFGSTQIRLDLDMPVSFLGYIKEHLILQMAYSAADVMIVPSIEETFGQTVTEAMACETPVIAFKKTGPEGIVDHLKTGYLSKFKDVKDLSRGIGWVLNSRKRIAMLSRNARLKVETTYDIRLIAKQYRELYDNILNKIE